jgi:hypothetical protein
MRILQVINRWLHNSWFNVGYLFASQVANFIVEGLGWGLAILYFIMVILIASKTEGVYDGR